MPKGYTLDSPLRSDLIAPSRCRGGVCPHDHPDPVWEQACERCQVADREPNDRWCEPCGWKLHGPREELIEALEDAEAEIAMLRRKVQP